MRTTIKYLGLMGLSAAMLFGMGSCSKDDASGDTGKSQSLVIKLSNVKTRAVEDQQIAGGVTDINIDDLTTRVYLLNGNTILDSEDFDSGEFDGTNTLTKRMEQVPAAVNYVFVVANMSDADVLALESASTLSDVENYRYTIASQSTTGLADKLLMGGTSNLVETPQNLAGHEDHLYKVATVQLAAITARMEVGAVRKGDGVKSVDLVGVWINHYYEDGSKATVNTYEYNDPIWVTNPAAGVSDDQTAFNGLFTIPTYDPEAYYDPAQNDKVELIKGSQAYAYHVFAGENIPHLILLVKGEYDPGYEVNGNQYFLKWVTFTRFLYGGTEIGEMAGNCIYKIGVIPSNATGLTDEDTGIIINADDLTDFPELPMFDLSINVTVAPWTSVNVTPGV